MPIDGPISPPQQPVGGPAAPSPVIPPRSIPNSSDVSRLTDEEYMAALNASRDAEIDAQRDADGTPALPPVSPTDGFWNRLQHGATAGRFRETPRQTSLAQDVAFGKMTGKAALRGTAKMLNNTGRAALEFGMWLNRKSGLGELTNPGFNDEFDAAGGARGFIAQNEEITHVIPEGNRVDDPWANFIESTAQFLTGFAAASAFLPATTTGVGKAVSGIAAGAIADATAFDPYEAQIAELMAKAPKDFFGGPAIAALGELLTVKGDDGALKARIKRAVPGAALGLFFEGLIATTRTVRSVRILADARASVEEKDAAVAAIAEAEQAFEDLASIARSPEALHAVPLGEQMRQEYELLPDAFPCH